MNPSVPEVLSLDDDTPPMLKVTIELIRQIVCQIVIGLSRGGLVGSCDLPYLCS
jgi:hypothetical protein